jgi:UDP-N-acetyl-D-glucosamine dehydrogenase
LSSETKLKERSRTTQDSEFKELHGKIKERRAKVGVMGLGYVGLPLALAFAKEFQVVGYDPNRSLIDDLRQGKSQIWDVTDEEVSERIKQTFSPTASEIDIAECDLLIICVPTPLIHEREPDLSYIKACAGAISTFLRKGQFVILESTTYPGTTEEVVVPILERSGLKAGLDFGVAYSQERVDPGNRSYPVESIPKVVGGLTPECTAIAAALYESIIPAIIEVSDCKTAEACKILENVFRSVNIALINEMALVFERMDINTWEVISAAASKPFGYMPFYPGPGIGGHCIPLDPYYMAYKARRCGVIPRFIELSGEINDFMRIHAVNLVEKGLAMVGKVLSESQIAVLGLTYKREIDDVRESPAKTILDELVKLGCGIKVYDPYVSRIETRSCSFQSEGSLEEAVNGVDCALFLMDHEQFIRSGTGYLRGLMRHTVVVDCKNIFSDADMKGFVYLAIGKPGHSGMTATKIHLAEPMESLSKGSCAIHPA